MNFLRNSVSLSSMSLALSLSLGLAVTQIVWAQEADSIEKKQVATESKEPLSITELRTFVEVMEKVKNEYVEDVTDQNLLENAIKGMLSNLDPHSSFYGKEEFEGLTESTTGEFAGLGVEITNEDGLLRIISPIDDSPAAKAGIKAGDLIIRINETAIQSVSSEDAIKMLRGEPGTEVMLTIIREGAAKPLKISILRDIIKTKSVRSEMLEPGFGYIRLSQFQERAGEEMINHINDLIKNYQASIKMATKDSHKDKATDKSINANATLSETTQNQNPASAHPLKGLILDLRNNPGGLVNQAVAISDLFLEGGLVVYTQGRDASTRSNSMAGPGDILNGAPLIVLINSGSASASEIVAGALKDNNRALIVGERSFGKGSVQVVIPLNDGRGLKFTTARYYTPSGKSIQAEGIVPDIAIEDFDIKVKSDKPERIREADLVGHLDNTSAINKADTQQSKQDLATRDYQLYEALNLLKTLTKSTELANPLNKPDFEIPPQN